MKKLILAVLLAAVFQCEGFIIKENCKKSGYSVDNRYGFLDCLLCKNVVIKADENIFKVLAEKVVVFQGGHFESLNSNFFKSFPETEHILFANSTINLTSSKSVKANNYMKLLTLIHCNITSEPRTNSFHGLLNLESFMMIYGLLQNSIIEETLLRECRT